MNGHLPRIIELSSRLRDAENQVQDLIEEIMHLEDCLQEYSPSDVEITTLPL